MDEPIGVLYSYKRCPYAIRARVMLNLAGLDFELFEVDLRNKPDRFLAISSKGTVPVLVLADGRILDESIDIVRYAEQESLPDGWQQVDENDEPRGSEIIELLNNVIIPATNHLRWPERYEGKQELARRSLQACLGSLSIINGSLLGYLSVFDVIAFPTIRQLYRIEPDLIIGHSDLESWLLSWVESPAFKRAMTQCQTTID